MIFLNSSSFSKQFAAIFLPFGCSEILPINWMMFSWTFSELSCKSAMISSKKPCSRISFFPLFICAKDANAKELASRTSGLRSFNNLQSPRTQPSEIMLSLPGSVKLRQERQIIDNSRIFYGEN